MIKNEKIKKGREFIAIEAKTGVINSKPEHIINDIIYPLEEIYKAKIHYMLIGCKNFIYSDHNYNILNNRTKKIYDEVKNSGKSIFIAHFPFDRKYLNTTTKNILSNLSGIYQGNSIYDSNNSNIEITLNNGKVLRGKFFPEKISTP